MSDSVMNCDCPDVQFAGLIDRYELHNPACEVARHLLEYRLVQLHNKPLNEPVDNIELQLLAIDLGDSCVVKVERGDGERMAHAVCPQDGSWHGGEAMKAGQSTYCFDQSFATVRDAIDAKPVPRIEQLKDADGDSYYHVVMHGDSDAFSPNTYEALTELVGKPLPIWKGGEWEQIHIVSEHSEGTSVGVHMRRYPTLWRYTRYAAK